jgi:hypothetical protein
MKKLIADCTTGEVFERDFTDLELKQYEKDQRKWAAEQVEAEAKAEAKTAAQAKLAVLGLTVEDLQALGL